jgi:hypothetical protein
MWLKGVEPPRPCEHGDLNAACLPIPGSGTKKGPRFTGPFDVLGLVARQSRWGADGLPVERVCADHAEVIVLARSLSAGSDSLLRQLLGLEAATAPARNASSPMP